MAILPFDSVFQNPTFGGGGAGVAGGFVNPTFGSAPGKGYFIDGDYKTANPCGSPVAEFPFLDQDDTETVIFKQPWEQFGANYVPPPMDKIGTVAFGAYFLGDANFQDGGCGVMKFERRFGNIPKQRKTSASFSYPYQLMIAEGGSYNLQTQAFTVDSTLTYDYFIRGKEADFPLLNAPKYIKLSTFITKRGAAIDGGAFPLRILGNVVVGLDGVTHILAEDDAYEDWHGAIRARKRRTIVAPTVAFWGELIF